MNSRDLINDAVRGKETRRSPIWLMRQAGRHLPEYRELRKGKSFEDMLFTPEFAAEVTLQPVKRYKMDAGIIFSDILLPIYQMNRDLKILPGKGPVIAKPISRPEDIAEIGVVSDYDELRVAFGTVRKKIEDTGLIGFSGSPYTLSSYLIEGKSTKDSVITKSFAISNPSEYKKLLELLRKSVYHQLMVQIEEGADFVQIFDSWAGHLSPEQYKSMVFGETEKLVRDVSKKVPVIFYARGASHLLSVLKDLSVNGFSIDHTTTIPKAREIVGTRTIQGNLDPAVLFSGGELLIHEIRRIIAEGREQPGHIFNLAQGINKDTPVDNVRKLVSEVKGGIKQ